jgi:hypothetical protein
MNIRAKCVNAKCGQVGVERSVAVGTLTGYGAKNERVKCPECGDLLQTRQSIAVKPRGKGRNTSPRRKPPSRGSGRSR